LLQYFSCENNLPPLAVPDWQDNKVDGIDLAAQFWWIDDHPDVLSKNVLAEHGLTNRLLVISSDQQADALEYAIEGA
jgi:hypothetical protein